MSLYYLYTYTDSSFKNNSGRSDNKLSFNHTSNDRIVPINKKYTLKT